MRTEFQYEEPKDRPIKRAVTYPRGGVKVLVRFLAPGMIEIETYFGARHLSAAYDKEDLGQYIEILQKFYNQMS